MPLVVRRVKVTDIPLLELLEQEALRRFPGRVGWLETYRNNIQRALSDEPEGILVADFEGHVVGAVIVQQRGKHPVTNVAFGVLMGLTVADKWRNAGVGLRLLKEAEMYLKARGCKALMVRLPADAGTDGNVFQDSGFKVMAWELEKSI